MNCFLDIFRCVSKRRSASPINLIDLPELVLENILENLDFHSILILRKVCHGLRDIIDDLKSCSHLTTIFINVQSKLISLELYFPSGSKSFNGSQIFHIEFHKNADGCLLKYYRKRKLMRMFLENEDFVETAMNDLKTLMIHQKSILKTFRLEFEYYNNPAQDFDRNLEPISEKVLGRIKKILKSRTSPIQVDDFQMTVIRQEQVAQILPLVNSKVLQKIEISGKKSFPMDSFETDELEKLEQWNQAKDLKIWRFDVLAPFETFTRFRNVDIFIQNVTVESILELKEIYKDCPSIEHFNIKFKFIDDHQLLIDSLGPETTKNEENGVIELRWLYRIPVSQKRLWISFFSSRFITFKVVNSYEVLRIFRPLEL